MSTAHAIAHFVSSATFLTLCVLVVFVARRVRKLAARVQELERARGPRPFGG